MSTKSSETAPKATRERRYRGGDFASLLSLLLGITETSAKNVLKQTGLTVRNALISGHSVRVLGIGTIHVIARQEEATGSVPRRIPRRLIYSPSKAFLEHFDAGDSSAVDKSAVQIHRKLSSLKPALARSHLGTNVTPQDLWEVLCSSWRKQLLEQRLIQIPHVGTIEYTAPLRLNRSTQSTRTLFLEPSQEFALQIARRTSSEALSRLSSDQMTMQSFGLDNEPNTAQLMPPSTPPPVL